MVTLAIPTYVCFDRLAACVASARAGTLAPDTITIIDNSGGSCPPIEGCAIVMGRQPQSVSKAWNDAVALAAEADHLIICNDDILFAPNTIRAMVAVAEQQPKAGIVSPLEGARFSCFLLNRQAYADVGAFDEQFWGAYFEDNDYAWRLTVAGWDLALARSNVQHAGSATIAAMSRAQLEEKHRAYDHNEKYFQRKWGAAPGHERYTVPFGGRL